MTNPKKNNWINNYLRRIGEKPVVLNKKLVEKSIAQIQSNFENKGYFNSVVNIKNNYKKKKVVVNYNIYPGDSYLINTIQYQLTKHDSINQLINKKIQNTEIKTGDLFTYDALNNERIRIEKLLQNNGYYKFSKELIYIEADTTKIDMVDIKIIMKEAKNQKEYTQFSIDQVFIHVNSGEMNKQLIGAWVAHLDCDRVVRERGNKILICKTIEDAIIIEEQDEALGNINQ